MLTEKEEIMENCDVIVIGAGNGGLTASAALAQKGLNVLLLEKHNIPGGCATSFCRGRFEFEVALHQLSGLGTPDKPGQLRTKLDSLGVMDDLTFVESPDLYTVRMPDGFHLSLKPDKDQIISELKEKFPREKTAIDKFFNLIYKYAEEFIGAFLFRDPEASREKYPNLYQYTFNNFNDVLNGFFTDPLLKTVLSAYWGYMGISPDRLSFANLAMMLFQYIELKPFHLKGGSQALSNAILNKFLAYGGTVHFNCGVKQILVENGCVKGVVTEHGENITAKYVVSNASQVSTYGQLIGKEHVPNDIFKDIRGRKLSTSAINIYLGFDCEPAELGITESTNFLLATTDTSEKAVRFGMQSIDIKDDFIGLSCYDVADPDFSPLGTCQASLIALKYGEPWLRILPAQYTDAKFRCAEAMLRRVEAIYPDLRNHIEEIEVATPLTFMRYLGHPGGAIYGFEQQTKDSLFFHTGRYSPIQGLYFAGGWGGDCGFEPTLRSGFGAARSIMRQLDSD